MDAEVYKAGDAKPAKKRGNSYHDWPQFIDLVEVVEDPPLRSPRRPVVGLYKCKECGASFELSHTETPQCPHCKQLERRLA